MLLPLLSMMLGALADPKTSDEYHQRQFTIGYGKSSSNQNNNFVLTFISKG
jgi:hypothetical protein